MLSKKHRLPRELFDKVLEKGRFFRSPNLTLKVLPAPDGISRFSFVTSGKVSKKATERNLFRRRGYATAAKLLFQLKSPLWIAIFFKPSVKHKVFSDIESELTEILLQ
ncbi:hypothetical protein A3I25_00410 [Candidatus Nomurabacteria bacterium RIFCSPLOWO2_02_FULL_42_17]|uniref:Uncharacterized protein n=2 Tax=Candidatus Nomuraibacteriota TaxID=1752729 RepID=A0A1F6WIY2_9BACT|nr:MAG: hypothetical protein A3B93_02015 [Candidatus Nomurabacteria bacterium RIFCSPHIGHO2_02_FULL_42_24]OGI96207.1 MAG: hypothetical protein A3I25_00410 [Candidatus Nomurabacteria bacterium RIFCSPLOWO2_02_FULL_42_17]